VEEAAVAAAVEEGGHTLLPRRAEVEAVAATYSPRLTQVLKIRPKTKERKF
jgi:hypothetical protein